MTYNLEIEGLVAYKHKLEAEIKRLRDLNTTQCRNLAFLDAEIVQLRAVIESYEREQMVLDRIARDT